MESIETVEEKETLLSIFPEEFTCNGQEWTITINSTDETDTINCPLFVKLVFKLNNDYPNSVPVISVYHTQQRISYNALSYIQEELVEQAKSCIGQSMIYDLVIRAREILQNLEDTLSMGTFSYIPSEVLSYVFTFLDGLTFGRLMFVSKPINKLTNNEELWKSFCIRNILDEKEMQDELRLKIGSWRLRYINIYRNLVCYDKVKVQFEYTWAASIKERQGTSDRWPEKDNWKEYFLDEMTNRNLMFEMEKNGVTGIIKYGEEEIGKLKLLNCAEAERVYRSQAWWRDKERCNIKRCRYVGDDLGFILFTLSNYNEDDVTTEHREFLQNLAMISRGVITNIPSKKRYPCVMFLPLWINIGAILVDKDKFKLNCAKATINRKHTNLPVNLMAPFTKKSTYSKKINKILWLNAIIMNRKSTNECAIWFWVISTHVADAKKYQNQNLDSLWSTIEDPFWIKTMAEKSGDKFAF